MTASDDSSHSGTMLLPRAKAKTARPPLYKVMLLNDDYTPMDFVVTVLKAIFHKPHEEAIQLMLDIHHQGQAICGIFTRDIAETKTTQVLSLAREQEYPLQCVMEREGR